MILIVILITIISWPWRGWWRAAYLEQCRVFVSIVVLLSRVLPRDPENGFLLVLPHQARVLAAVDLLDEPLPELAIAAVDWHAAVPIYVHPCRHTHTQVQWANLYWRCYTVTRFSAVFIPTHAVLNMLLRSYTVYTKNTNAHNDPLKQKGTKLYLSLSLLWHRQEYFRYLLPRNVNHQSFK